MKNSAFRGEKETKKQKTKKKPTSYTISIKKHDRKHEQVFVPIFFLFIFCFCYCISSACFDKSTYLPHQSIKFEIKKNKVKSLSTRQQTGFVVFLLHVGDIHLVIPAHLVSGFGFVAIRISQFVFVSHFLFSANATNWSWSLIVVFLSTTLCKWMCICKFIVRVYCVTIFYRSFSWWRSKCVWLSKNLTLTPSNQNDKLNK